jgi:hypothetical protein
MGGRVGMEDGWLQVRLGQQVGGASGTVRLRPVSLSAGEVTVTVEVDASAPEAVWFSDGSYGLTAWAWDGGAWRRADTADMRIMMAPSLGPGELASVTLPVTGSPSRVRVLVRTPADGLGAWTDVSA